MNIKDFQKVSETISDVFNNTGANSTNMIGFNKIASVVSYAYVEEDVANEDILEKLLAYVNQIYIGYVLTTLGLANVIDNYSVVRTILERVSTEEFKQSSNFQIAVEAIEQNFGSLSNISISTEADVQELDKKIGALAHSKVIEFEFIVGTPKPDGKPTTVKVPINVSIIPGAISRAVATAFLNLNFETNFSTRFAKWRAGEISLFSDLILSRDIINNMASAMKEDHSNVLKTMFDAKNSARSQILKKAYGVTKNNIASSIMIFDKRTFESSIGEASVDFNEFNDRQKFFDSSLALLVCVVDLNYKIIDIYYNGLKQHSSIPFRIIEKAGGSKDSFDIKTLMATLAKGNAPKF